MFKSILKKKDKLKILVIAIFQKLTLQKLSSSF